MADSARATKVISRLETTGRSDQNNMQTPPRENTAAWVEDYVSWASKVLDEKARTDE
jgi:hypothetical protein